MIAVGQLAAISTVELVTSIRIRNGFLQDFSAGNCLPLQHQRLRSGMFCTEEKGAAARRVPHEIRSLSRPWGTLEPLQRRRLIFCNVYSALFTLIRC